MESAGSMSWEVSIGPRCGLRNVFGSQYVDSTAYDEIVIVGPEIKTSGFFGWEFT